MRLFLIRHAESENNARPEHERVEDPELTERGHRQARYLAAWAGELQIDFLLTSPFTRTLQTARYLADALRREVEIGDDLFERGGCYRGWGLEIAGGRGCNREEILNQLPTALIPDSITDAGWWNGRNPETEAEAIARARRVTARWIERYGDSEANVVAIIHADFKRHLLVEMLREHADADRFGPLCNAGVSLIEYRDCRWQMHWLNSVGHLPPREITGAKG